VSFRTELDRHCGTETRSGTATAGGAFGATLSTVGDGA